MDPQKVCFQKIHCPENILFWYYTPKVPIPEIGLFDRFVELWPPITRQKYLQVNFLKIKCLYTKALRRSLDGSPNFKWLKLPRSAHNEKGWLRKCWGWQEPIKPQIPKNRIFVFWAGGLRMARMAPSRQGDMDGPQDKLGVSRKKSNIKEKSKKPRKSSLGAG